MRRIRALILVFVAASTCAPAVAPAARAQAEAVEAAGPRIQPPEPGTLASVMLAITEAAAVRRATLEERLAATDDVDERQALQAELARAKQGEELDLLRAQLDFAMAEGRPEWATTLASAIERILHPPDLVDPEAVRLSAERKRATRGEEAPR